MKTIKKMFFIALLIISIASITKGTGYSTVSITNKSILNITESEKSLISIKDTIPLVIEVKKDIINTYRLIEGNNENIEKYEKEKIKTETKIKEVEIISYRNEKYVIKNNTNKLIYSIDTTYNEYFEIEFDKYALYPTEKTNIQIKIKKKYKENIENIPRDVPIKFLFKMDGGSAEIQSNLNIKDIKYDINISEVLCQ